MDFKFSLDRFGAICLILLGLMTSPAVMSADPVRVAVLKFGTVNWELNVLKHHNLDQKFGVDVEVQKLGSKNATTVALQGGAADILVSDWIWVSRQRAEGKDYVFFPYSLATGKLMVAADSGIEKPGDLAGNKLGIAGGPVDKSWLLFQAWYKKTTGNELADNVEPTFGAPPLLNKIMLRGEIPAAINFWHYTARLEAAGMKPILSVAETLPELGINNPVPLLGWVFSESWAKANPDKIAGFLQATYAAKSLLKTSDAEWDRIRSLTKAEDDQVFTTLRSAFRAGIPTSYGDAEIQSSARLFEILAKIGGEKLVGKSTTLTDGTFWTTTKVDPLNQ